MVKEILFFYFYPCNQWHPLQLFLPLHVWVRLLNNYPFCMFTWYALLRINYNLSSQWLYSKFHCLCTSDFIVIDVMFYRCLERAKTFLIWRLSETYWHTIADFLYQYYAIRSKVEYSFCSSRTSINFALFGLNMRKFIDRSESVSDISSHQCLPSNLIVQFDS